MYPAFDLGYSESEYTVDCRSNVIQLTLLLIETSGVHDLSRSYHSSIGSGKGLRSTSSVDRCITNTIKDSLCLGSPRSPIPWARHLCLLRWGHRFRRWFPLRTWWTQLHWSVFQCGCLDGAFNALVIFTLPPLLRCWYSVMNYAWRHYDTTNMTLNLILMLQKVISMVKLIEINLIPCPCVNKCIYRIINIVLRICSGFPTNINVHARNNTLRLSQTRMRSWSRRSHPPDSSAY